MMQDAGVAAYLCGHEHDLQYITKTPPTPGGQPAWPVYVVSGAGSNMRADEIKDYKPRVSRAARVHGSSSHVPPAECKRQS